MKIIDFSWKWWVRVFALFFLAYLFIGFRFFLPFHAYFAFIFIFFAFILIFKFFYYLIWPKIKGFKLIILMYVSAFLITWAVFTIFPLGSPFIGMSEKEVAEILEEDLDYSLQVLDRLKVNGDNLVNFLKENDFLDREQTKQLKNFWLEFVYSFVESEQITEKYKYFYSFDHRNREKAFLLSYSLYSIKYQMIFEILNNIEYDNEKVIFNEYIQLLDSDDVFVDLSSRIYDAATFLRFNLGHAYLSFFDLPDDYRLRIFYLEALNANNFLRENTFELIANLPNSFFDSFEELIFDAWFPVQKEVSELLEYRISSRENGFITYEQINEMRDEMKIGDFMMQRRNWYLTNVGLPGFWPHSALYVGKLDEQNEYFSDFFPYRGYDDFKSLLKNEYPKVYFDFSKVDEFGFEKSVIESVSEGVILQSLEHSADADFVAVLRPNLSKKDKMLAILRAYSNYGKEYDYDFNVHSVDALFCSELIYDAYLPSESKKGFVLDSQIISGRDTIPVITFLERYILERNEARQTFEFVYFLKGNEELGVAEISDENTFIESINWSKYDFLQ